MQFKAFKDSYFNDTFLEKYYFINMYSKQNVTSLHSTYVLKIYTETYLCKVPHTGNIHIQGEFKVPLPMFFTLCVKTIHARIVIQAASYSHRSQVGCVPIWNLYVNFLPSSDFRYQVLSNNPPVGFCPPHIIGKSLNFTV